MLHKSVVVLNCIAEDKRNLTELVEATGLSRATAHRLAVGLEEQGLLRRTSDGRFALGLHLLALGRCHRSVPAGRARASRDGAAA
ncbi:MAG: helix-turn-helix domain-containing protein [Microthrixaceae bacterium]|nr:helix-turn-helix domain-containing protein [Microthrixaceae bacterium]